MSERIPRIRPRKDRREIKWLITFYIDEADQVQAKDGLYFVPVKVEVKNWPRLGRCYVTVTGPAQRHPYRQWPGTANFDIKGCPEYAPVPEWLKSLVKEAMTNEEADRAEPT